MDVLHALFDTTQTSVVMATLGAFILGFSSIFTGLNFIVTINTMRPPGMTWFRMPLFLWATYSTSIIQVLATPVLGITLLLLIAERVLHIGILIPSTTETRLRSSTSSGSTATRRVHHDFARFRHHQRIDQRAQPQEHLRLSLHRIQLGGDCVARVYRVGSPHVYLGYV